MRINSLCFFLVIVMPFLSACGKGQQADLGETTLPPQSLFVEFSDGQKLDFSGDGDRVFVVRDSPLLTGEKKALEGRLEVHGVIGDDALIFPGTEFIIGMTMKGIGRYGDAEVDVEFRKNNTDHYFHYAGASEFTHASVMLARRDDNGGIIEGTFEVDACLLEGLNAVVCQDDANRLVFHGSFLVHNNVKPTGLSEGTREAPEDLDYWSLGHALFSLGQTDSFFVTTVPGPTRIKFAELGNNVRVSIALFDNADFKKSFCTIDSSKPGSECLAGSSGEKKIYLRVINQGGSASADFSLDVRPVDPWKSEGSENAPIVVEQTLPIRHLGSVGDQSRSVYQLVVPKNEAVAVRIEDVTGIVNGFVSEFGTTNTCALVGRVTTMPARDNDGCVLNTTSGRLLVTIAPSSQSSGDKYAITIARSNVFYPNQGSLENPLPIEGMVPLQIDATIDNSSYYVWQGEKNKIYTFSFSKLPTLSLLSMMVYEDFDQVQRRPRLACAVSSDRQSAACTAKSVTGKFLLQLQGRFGQGVKFQLGIQEGGKFFESENRQLGADISNTVEGTVGVTPSVYTYSVVPGKTYSVMLSRRSHRQISATVTASNDVKVLCQERYISPSQSICSFSSPSNTVTVTVRASTVSGGGSFTLSVNEGGITESAEGSESSPVALFSASPELRGSTNSNGSFYRMPVTIGMNYRVTLTPIDFAADLRVKGGDGQVRCLQTGMGMLARRCELTARPGDSSFVILVTPALGVSSAQYHLAIAKVITKPRS